MRRGQVLLGQAAALAVTAVITMSADVGLASAAPLPCDVTTPTECQVTTLRALGAGGAYEVDRGLRIGAGGELRVDAGGTLALAVAGELAIEVGGKITGNAATASGVGAAIDITATGPIVLAGNGTAGAVISADQNAGSCSGGKGGRIGLISTFGSAGDAITLESGSRISVNARCSAGAIAIAATNGGVDVRGVVESVSGLSGTGGKQAPGGGPISIVASCNLIVNDTGRVSSRGGDPGADLVHLAAGEHVAVIGLVESTGRGHTLPNAPRNQCAGPDRPDKPLNAIACVEIWAGKTLVIDRSGTNHGEVNADAPQGGGATVTWIDLYARKSITINGPGGGPYAGAAAPYAVHANQSVTNSEGGIITVKSLKGAVALAGQALQADATVSGGKGGAVVIEAGAAAGGDVDLGAASVRARGSATGGGPQSGGDVAVRSFNGRVLGAAPGELNASGGTGKTVPELGTVTLAGCAGTPSAVDYGGTPTPPAAVAAPSCGGKPTLPAYVVFPVSACAAPRCQGPDCPPPPCSGPDCPPPPCQGPDCPPPPCSGPDCPPPPCSGPDCPPPPCTGPNCPPPPCTGTACPPPPCTGAGCAPYTYFCEKGSVKTVLDPVNGRFPGNLGPDVVVDVRVASLQAAIDLASDTNGDGYIIIGVVAQNDGLPGGSGRQEVAVARAYEKPFAVIGCGVTLLDPLPCDGQPVVEVLPGATSPEHPVGSGATLYFQEIAAVGSQSAAGWLVKGDGRVLEAIGSQMNMQGVKIVGNGNVLRNSVASTNFAGGVVVKGDGNTVEGVISSSNAGGDGVLVTGNANTIADSTAGDAGQANGKAGFNVNGQGNLVKGNRAFGNAGNGFTVAGGTAPSPNKLKHNVAGAPGRGNAAHGIDLGGTGQGAAGVPSLVGNVAQSNGYIGLKVTGTGHRLKDNTSGGPLANNGACQYFVAPGNWNGTGNKRGTVPIGGADGSPFPGGCL